MVVVDVQRAEPDRADLQAGIRRSRAPPRGPRAGVNAGHRETPGAARSGSDTGRPVAQTSTHGPSPRVNCSSSTVPLPGSEAHRTPRCPAPVMSMMPTPVTSRPSTQSRHRPCEPGRSTTLAPSVAATRPPNGRNGTLRSWSRTGRRCGSRRALSPTRVIVSRPGSRAVHLRFFHGSLRRRRLRSRSRPRRAFPVSAHQLLPKCAISERSPTFAPVGVRPMQTSSNGNDARAGGRAAARTPRVERAGVVPARVRAVGPGPRLRQSRGVVGPGGPGRVGRAQRAVREPPHRGQPAVLLPHAERLRARRRVG